MKRKKKSRKIVGALLALTMGISSMGAPVSAMEMERVTDEIYAEEQNPEVVSESEINVSEQSAQTKTILRFQDLTEEITVQNVMQGITQEALNLPKTLEAEDMTNNRITVPVVWEAEPSFDGNVAGEYQFLPVLADGYEVAEGENLPQIHVTVTAEETQEDPENTEVSEVPEPPTPSKIPENMEEESKTEEESESVTISSLQLLGDGTEGGDVTVGLSGDTTFSIPTALEGTAKTVWLGYRFTLPKNSPSGGSYKFVNGSYGWLHSLDGGAPVVKEEGGYLILEGKVEAQKSGGDIAPGVYGPSITISVKDLVGKEKATLKAECWLIESEDKKVEAEATITSEGHSAYEAMIESSSSPVSGYLNPKTGGFSFLKPENADGYVYGRVYRVISRAWADTKTERLDPTRPLSFDFSYYLTKTEDGKEVVETDEEYQPILLGIKRDDNTVPESQLAGTLPIKDVFTLGGLIADGSGHNGPYNTGFYHGGDYTFTEKEKGTLHISAVLSKENKNSGYRHVSTYGMFFVPLKDNDSAKRRLYFEIDNMEGTSYSGDPIQIKETTPLPVKVYRAVQPKQSEDPVNGLFSRENYVSINIVQKEGEFANTCVVSNRKNDSIADYGVNALNILMKFDSGLELKKKAYEVEKSFSSNYSGDYRFLYGLKPDGKDWENEIELNHTEDDELVYYDDYETAKKHGKIVAVLAELRNGVWIAGERLMFRGDFDAVGDSGSSHVLVQDIKIWRGDTPYTTSWAGTNGTDVSHDVEPRDKMVPYDNPDNKDGEINQRVYRKDTWPEGAEVPVATERSIWGDTIFIVGGSVAAVNEGSVNLNGDNIGKEHGPYNEWWSSAAFDTSLNQRIVDRVFQFEVKGSEGKELTLQIDLDKEESTYKDYLHQTGSVYLSTPDNPVTYIPNEDKTQQGTFQGGRIINPKEFTVPGDGTYAIYYSSYIGNADDLSKDAPKGIQWNQTKLKLLKDTQQYVKAGRLWGSYAVTISRTSSESVDMISTSEAGVDKAGYLFSMTSEEHQIDNIFMLDVLPYIGDERGSSFHGSYTLLNNEVKIAYQNGAGDKPVSDVKVYYTVDEKIRKAADGACATAAIFDGLVCSDLGNEFSAGGVTWSLADADQTWTLPEGTQPTAIVVCGMIGAKERVTASLNLDLTGQKVGDTYYNVTSNLIGRIEKAIESETAMVKIMGRNLSGKVWEDMDQSGTFDGNDNVLENVEVQLFDANGKKITEDAAGEPYEKVVTGEDGSYTFENVPERPSGYYVQFNSNGNTSLDDYQTIASYQGKAPYDKANDSDVLFRSTPEESVKTDTFTLLTDDDLKAGSIVQEADGVNAGFEKLAVIRAEMRWNGKADTEDQVSVQLQRRQGEDSQWENTKEPDVLNDNNQWKTSFDDQVVFYQDKDKKIGRYEYRVAEVDETGKVVEDGETITLNNNQYRVNYVNEADTNTWEITNSRFVDLEIENEVAGEFGDRTKEFTIEITAKDSKSNPLSGTFACGGLEGTDKITFDEEGKGQISLAHEDKLLIKDLPAGTQITVTVVVQKEDGYNVTYQVNNEEQEDASLQLTAQHNSVKIINTKGDIPETGISHNSTITGILIFVGIFGIAYVGIVILRKRRGIR